MAKIDVVFRLSGSSIPADHGYLLYSAVTDIIPSIHGDEEVGIHPISGIPVGGRLISLTDNSSLILRISPDRMGQILALAGNKLRLDDHYINVGVPHAKVLQSVPRLYSRLVVIKGFMEPERFLEAARRQLDEMNVEGDLKLVDLRDILNKSEDRQGGTRSPLLRRTLRIKDKEIVGFAVQVDSLNNEESLKVQELGMGGRRRFGCGIFIPNKR